MSCRHYYQSPSFGGTDSPGDSAFSVEGNQVTFGPGALSEAGDRLRGLSCARVALFTDRTLAALPPVHTVRAALSEAGVDAAVFDEVEIEPSDASFLAAARFLREGRFDGVISVGGGSVMDTAKAALLYATYPADFLTYVNAPVGAGQPVPGPLRPHLACPTTSGTGSESTGIAVCGLDFDAGPHRGRPTPHIKTGIAHRRLRPTLALIDPTCAATLPASVVAASGFDVLSHALESYTALPYTDRARPERPSLRPMSQGANPFSDLGSLEALRLCGAYLLRAVRDAGDTEARHQMMYAATLAGIAFGNAGVHVPHGMAYAVAGQVRDFRLPGYPGDRPLIPHGLSVILSAPAAFRYTAFACPQRHLRAAAALGADTRDAALEGDSEGDRAGKDAGEVLASTLLRLHRDAGLPNGLVGVGYRDEDVGALAEGTLLQTRLLRNAPREVGEQALHDLFHDALRYW